MVVGEAGIGKSRLVAEVVDRVEASAGRVLGAACLPYHTDVSLWPISRLLERVVGSAAEEADPVRGLMAHLTSLGLDPQASAPFLGPLLGITETTEYAAPQLDSSAFLDETLARVVEWLSALGRRTPHVFVVEDLHWADPSTLALLGLVAAERPGGILTLTTTRALGGSVAGCCPRPRARPPGPRRVHDPRRQPLQREGPRRRAARLHRRAGRRDPPLHRGLTRSCLDEDRTDAMPLRLQELFTWRLKAPRVDLRVVQAAATIGPAFDADTVAAVVGDQHLVDEQLAVLTAEGVIEPGDQAARAYRFRHALMRDAAYETQVLDVRRLTHATRRGGARRTAPSRLSSPSTSTWRGRSSAAAAQYLVAGQAEQGRGAHVEATRLLSRAIELAGAASRSRPTATCVSSPLGCSGQPASVRCPGICRAGRPGGPSSRRGAGGAARGAPGGAALAHRHLGLLARARRSRHDARAHRAPRRHGPRGRLLVVQPRGGGVRRVAAVLRGPTSRLPVRIFEISMDRLPGPAEDQAISPFWPLPNDPIAVSLIALSCISTARGDLVEAAVGARGHPSSRADRVPRGPFSPAFVKTFAAWNARFVGDDEKSRRLGEEVVALGEGHGYALWTALGSAYAPPVPTGGAEHRAFLEQVITTVRLMGQESFTAAYLGYLAELHADVGEVTRALECVGEACQVVEKTGEDLHLPGCSGTGLATPWPPAGTSATQSPTLREAVRIATNRTPGWTACEPPWSSPAFPTDHRPADWRHRSGAARGAVLCPPPSPPTRSLPMRSSPPEMPRIVILGGGMAGLVTAWELSSRAGEIGWTRSRSTSGVGDSGGRARAAEDPTGASRNTVCTSSSAATTPPSGSCARCMASSTDPRQIRPARFAPGTTPRTRW